MKHTIERRRVRAPCATCDDEIGGNELRVAEVCNDGRIPNAKYRYHHLDCAIDAHPRLVREILVAGSFDPRLIAEPLGLNERLQARIDALDSAQPRPGPPDDDPAAPNPAPASAAGAKHQDDGSSASALETMLADLEDDPDDRALLAVLGDALVERGDPRGELIAIDLAIERAGRATSEQTVRQAELRSRLLPRVCRIEAAPPVWGIGFIRGLDTSLPDSSQLQRLGHAWRHRSLRVLTDLAIHGYASTWPTAFPPAIRRFTLGRFDLDSLDPFDEPPAVVEATIADMPRLERLTLRGYTQMRVRNAHVARIELGPNARPVLAPEALPAVVAISLDHAVGRERTSARDRLAALAQAGWLARLDELGIHDAIDRGCVEVLRGALGDRRLPRLDVSGTAVPADCLDTLLALCDELIGTRVAPTVGARIVHAKLGVGTIARMFDGKLEIEFADHGRRVFREDSPSLQIG